MPCGLRVVRASPDFPDEARPLIGPRFASGFGCGAVKPCGVGGRSKVEPLERSEAERPSQPDGPDGRVHHQPNPVPERVQTRGSYEG